MRSSCWRLRSRRWHFLSSLAAVPIGGWPTGGLADKLPAPTAGTVVKSEETSTDGGRAGIQKGFMILIKDWTREDAQTYTEQLKSAGFTNVDVDLATDALFHYMATNAEGCRAGVLYTSDAYVVSVSEVPVIK